MIHFLIPNLDRGGAENVAVRLANGFATSNILIKIIVLNTSNNDLRSKLNKRIKFTSLQKKRILFSFFAIKKELYSLGRNDHLIIFSYDLLILTYLVELLNPFQKIRAQIIFRNINTLSKVYTSSFKDKIRLFLIRKSLRKVNKIINQSHSMHEDLSYLGISENKMAVINNPGPEINDKPIPYISIPWDDYYVYVGRLENQKRVDKIIEIFYYHLKSNKSQDKLLIIGTGSQLIQLSKLADNYNLLNTSIWFLGELTNPLDYLKKAKACLLYSKFEGFPNVLVESITVGTPIISVNCPSGPSEIILDGINGFLIQEGDIDNYLKAMNLVNQLDRLNIINSSTRFQIDKITIKYLNFINSKIDKE